MKDNPHLAGESAILWSRCSTKGQADSSLTGQQGSVASFAADNGLTISDTIELPGISGSLVSKLMPFIEEVIERKRVKNDFTKLLVYDISRFCRAGARQGFSLENLLDQHGIELVQVANYQPPNEFTAIHNTIGYELARQFARSIASASARGMQQAIENGGVTHASRTPWGLDRLYLKNGVPQHIIRMQGPHRQEMLHPETRELIKVFERGDILGKFGYKRQRGETTRYIPGEAETVEHLRQMFRWHYVDGLGFHGVAHKLNDLGWLTFTGERWSANGVQRVVRNPVYLGKGLANKVAWGIYYTRSKGRPVANTTKLVNGNPVCRVRPEAEWEWIEEPMLAEFLPADVKAAAEPRIMEFLRTPKGTVSNETRKATKSKFFLSGLMRSTSGYSLIGKCQGRSRTDRYYKSQYGGQFKSANPNDRRHVRAERIEAFVEDVVREVIQRVDGLEDMAVAELSRCRDQRESLKANPAKLKKEMAQLTFQIENTHSRMKTPELSAVYGKTLDELERKLVELQKSLSDSLADQLPAEAPIREQARRLADQLKNDLNTWATMDGDRKHQILKALGTEIIVNMETLDAEVRMSLPASIGRDLRDCGLTVLLERSSIRQATVTDRLELALCRANVAIKPKPIGPRKNATKSAPAIVQIPRSPSTLRPAEEAVKRRKAA